uniref:Acyl-coenzyme A thioesterase 13 n=1 Tax=Cacopsylla melanoneura TaxID=428564 RepID=A0A8D8TFX6_9HEMI
MLTQIIKRIIESSANSNRFDKCLKGVNVITAGDGKCVAEMKVGKEHTNTYGTLHGGMTATLVDYLSGCALLTHNNVLNDDSKISHSGVSVDLHITYLRAAKLGEEIVIESNTRKCGKSLAFLDVLIKNKETGALLATGVHTKFIAGYS